MPEPRFIECESCKCTVNTAYEACSECGTPFESSVVGARPYGMPMVFRVLLGVTATLPLVFGMMLAKGDRGVQTSSDEARISSGVFPDIKKAPPKTLPTPKPTPGPTTQVKTDPGPSPGTDPRPKLPPEFLDPLQTPATPSTLPSTPTNEPTVADPPDTPTNSVVTTPPVKTEDELKEERRKNMNLTQLMDEITKEVEAELEKMYPLVKVGETLQFASTGGGSIQGKVAQLGSTGVVLQTPGGRVQYNFVNLPKSARIRCDRKFRTEVVGSEVRNRILPYL